MRSERESVLVEFQQEEMSSLLKVMAEYEETKLTLLELKGNVTPESGKQYTIF